MLDRLRLGQNLLKLDPSGHAVSVRYRLNYEKQWKSHYFVLFFVFKFIISITVPQPLVFRLTAGSFGA